MDFVYEQHRIGLLRQLLHDRFQALLKIAAIFGAGQQRAHVQRVNSGIGQHVGHIAFDDAACETLGDGGLADTGFTDQQRVVFAATAQGLDDAFEFISTADQWVYLAGNYLLVEIEREVFQRASRCGFGLGFLLGFSALGAAIGNLGHPMRDVIDDIEARYTLLMQEKYRMRILFAVYRDQHIGARDFLLAG